MPETSSDDTDHAPDHAAGASWGARLSVLFTVATLWLAWSGPLTFHHGLLTVLWPMSALLVLWLCERLGLVTDDTVPLRLTGRTLLYVPWLGWQVVRSCLDVLRRGLGRRLDIDPVTVELTTRTEGDLLMVSYANSITLTPGTLSLNVDEEHRLITVHAISPAGAEELREGEMDRRVARIGGAEPGGAG